MSGANEAARFAWCATRTLGDTRAVFQPFDTIRCPGTRADARGREVVCGYGQDSVGAGRLVIVRAGERRSVNRVTGDLNRICHRCGTRLAITILLVGGQPKAA